MTKYLAATAAYLRNLESDGVSPETINNYAKRLNLFYEFMLNGGYSESGPSFNTVFEWKQELIENGVKSIRSLKQYLVELRMFFKWASDPVMDPPYYAENPVADSLTPNTRKIDKRPYDELLTDEQIIQLMQNNPLKGTHPENWERNYAIVITLLFTKVRNAELLALSPADLDFENGEIAVEHGKGDKYRVVEFHPLAQAAIKLYLSGRTRPAGLSDTAPLFGTRADENGHTGDSGVWHAGTSRWLSALVERHVYAVTGVHDIRTHDLRHIGARLMLNSGASIEEISRELGHADISTTQIYCGRLRTSRANRGVKRIMEEAEYQAKKNEILIGKAAG